MLVARGVLALNLALIIGTTLGCAWKAPAFAADNSSQSAPSTAPTPVEDSTELQTAEPALPGESSPKALSPAPLATPAPAPSVPSTPVAPIVPTTPPITPEAPVVPTTPPITPPATIVPTTPPAVITPAAPTTPPVTQAAPVVPTTPPAVITPAAPAVPTTSPTVITPAAPTTPPVTQAAPVIPTAPAVPTAPVETPTSVAPAAPVIPSFAPATPPTSVAPRATAAPHYSIIPQDDPPPGFQAVEALCTAGRYKEALPKLQAFVNKGVANSKVRLYLGHAYYQTKQYKKALAEFHWVEKNSPLISVRRDAEGAAFSLDCYLKGICPGRCLKANAAGWGRLKGHPPNELWITFPFKGGSQSWSSHHIGEVIVYEKGRPVNKGKCPICRGTGRVTPLK